MQRKDCRNNRQVLAITRKRSFLNLGRPSPSSYCREPWRNLGKWIDPVAVAAADRTVEACRRTSKGRHGDYSDSLIRHARATPPSSIGALTKEVRLFAWLRLLVAPVGCTALLQPGPGSARRAAVPLAAITRAADKEKRTALACATAPRPEDDLRPGRFHARRTTRHETTIHERSDD